MKETVLSVKGMSCGHCVKAVEDALEPIGAKADVDLASGTVKVMFSEADTTIEQIKTAIEDQGYDVA